MSRPLIALVLAAFVGLTLVAVWQHGYWGILSPLLQSTAGAQVLADLAIALGLFMVWMWPDARAHGRNPWPWALLIVVAGSIGALLYLLTRPITARAG